mgnify:CR=1 FL=1
MLARALEARKAELARAKEELGDDAGNLRGFKDLKEFIDSIEKPRCIMFLVKAGKPVDETIEKFKPFLEEGDILIDGGNEGQVHLS